MTDSSGAVPDERAAVAARRGGAVSLAAFTLSLLVSLVPGVWTGSPGRSAPFAGALGMLLWALAFFYAVRAWRDLGRVRAPSPATRVLGHLPLIAMAATFLALALATITAG